MGLYSGPYFRNNKILLARETADNHLYSAYRTVYFRRSLVDHGFREISIYFRRTDPFNFDEKNPLFNAKKTLYFRRICEPFIFEHPVLQNGRKHQERKASNHSRQIDLVQKTKIR